MTGVALHGQSSNYNLLKSEADFILLEQPRTPFLPLPPNPTMNPPKPPSSPYLLPYPFKSHPLTPHSIVSTYNHLLTSDPLLTPPIAAIESLILLLSHSPPSTISETLSLLASSTSTLKSSVASPIALSAGTDLFQRYLISTLQSPQNKKGGANPTSGNDFQAIRTHLISNGRLFVSRAKEARTHIGALARRFIRDDSVVLTSGSSRVVGAVLAAALKAGTCFKLVYVSDSPSAPLPSTLPLASSDLPIAVIPPNAVAHALPRCTLVLLGAESVVENGGIISGMGTYQLGVLAKAAGKPVYVCAESFKFVRVFPLCQEDVGGDVLLYSEGGEGGYVVERRKAAGGVDYTPPELITALVTETGVHTPSAVSEELIKIWY